MVIDFDSKAKAWDTDPVKVERARVIAEEISARIPNTSHMSALEYGCGTGLLSFALQPLLSRVALADSSEGDALGAKRQDRLKRHMVAQKP